MSYLLDTNVVSELRKEKQRNPNVHSWFETVPTDDLYVSVLVIGEIRRGVEGLRPRDPAQAHILENWLTQLRSSFSSRLIPISPEVAEEWGYLNVGNRRSTIDSLMAATAKVHGMVLVSRNTKDVADTGIELLDPFRSRE